ncbi:MAG: AAA family ATPase [Oscillospiraceae bacterium]|jgi:chromosome segregation protein|nr:AAA family ATPase [Oscillospiraceae bacterium]
MRLKAIELYGFKSFPDKTRLEFPAGMSCVVGPNGSGKSNVADAVRWVLGEQSTKQLRGGKMEDVIFNGTGTRRPMGMAEVNLYLENTDRRLPIDSADVCVTRRLYRSGESEYRINTKSVRLRDVQELFLDTGLGRDGYALVGQGRVAELAAARSAHRRDMLEEAAGIAASRYHRETAEKRLLAAEENLVRLRDILEELESRVEPLRKQKEKAEAFLALAARRKVLEIGLALETISKTTAQLREQDYKVTKSQAQYRQAQDKLAALEQDLEALGDKTQDLQVLLDTLSEKQSQTKAAALRLEGEAAVLQNSISHNTEAIQRNRVALELLLPDGEAPSDGDIEAAIHAAAGERTALDRERSALLLRTQKNASDTAAAQSSVESNAKRMEALREAESNRESLLAGLTAQQADTKQALREAREKLAGFENSLQGYAMRLKLREEKAREARQKQREIEQTLHQAEHKLEILKGLEQNMEGYSGAVRAVLREAARGNLRGIHGTLSQLIRVDEDYTVAVETALGTALQYVVCDTEREAKAGVEFLKRAAAGRVTFLPLSSIRSSQFRENGLERCYGFLAMADEAVECDPAYREIVKAQLGRTAVAEDMDSAIAISRQYNHRFRIVTIDGQVLNAGGSITGGSRAAGAGILSRQNEIADTKAEIEEIQKNLTAQAAKAKKLTEEAAAGQADNAGLAGDYQNTKNDAVRLEAELAGLTGRLEDFARGAAERETEREALRAAEAQLADTIRRCETEMEELKAAWADLDSRYAAAEAQSRRLAARKQELEQAADLSAQIHALEADNARLGEELQQRTAAAAESAALSQRLQAEHDSTRQHITEQAMQSATLRREEKVLLAEREKYGAELARLQERLNTLQRTKDEAADRLFEEHNLTPMQAEAAGYKLESPIQAGIELTDISGKIRALGNINVDAIEEFKEVKERFDFLSGQVEDAEKSRKELIHLIDDLTERMKKRFTEVFALINTAFGECFAELFGGGKARLYPEDPADILGCPIQIEVQPPGKNVTNIDLLSGGEKGLASIAMLFAILRHNPAPFCIFDEVEAALDDVNVTRFARYVRRICTDTQFILISHRRGTMEEADILYGVTMQEEGVSKVLEMATTEIAAKVAAA